MPTLARARVQHSLTLALAGLVLLLAFRLALYLPTAATRPSHGFVAVYLLGRLLHQGEDLSQTYDHAWFSAQVSTLLPGIGDVNINPPPLALLGLPFAAFDYPTARTLWTLLSLACLVWAVYHILRVLDLRGPWALGFVAYVLLSQPVWSNFQLGQVYLVLLALCVVVWRGLRSGHARPLGLSLGLLTVFKLAGLFFWPLLVVWRRWRAIAWGVGVGLLVCLVSLLLMGWETWRVYPTALLDFNTDPSLAVTAYQTQVSLLWHLFTFDAHWNPSPLIVSPVLAAWLPRLSYALFLGLPLYFAWRRRADPRHTDLVFAALLVANVILGTLTLDYHYPLLLLPIAILIAHARRQGAVWPWLVLGLAMTLIAVNVQYRFPPETLLPLALLGYPKLYGGWLLWGLIVWYMYKGQVTQRPVTLSEAKSLPPPGDASLRSAVRSLL